VLELYYEGKEVACFASVEELAFKIEYYLAHPEERDAISHAGHIRCVPAYSYDQRMKEILRYHEALGVHPREIAS
jgi:spore maturation protein CgeB